MSISSTIELQDKMTAPLLNMVGALNQIVNSFEVIDDVSTIDTSSIEKAVQSLRGASLELSRLDNLSAEPKVEPVIDNFNAQPIEVPIKWDSSNNIDVFTNSGVERFEQEISNANSLLDDVVSNQQRISNQANNTDLFPQNMINDVKGLDNRITSLFYHMQDLSNKSLDDLGGEKVNNQVENLRNQLNMAISLQEKLSTSMENMDIDEANQAYRQLNNLIDSTERNIRDNFNAQEQFNQSIQDGSSFMDGLKGKIGSAIAVYTSMKTVQNGFGLADEMNQLSARLNLMNKGLQTTQELQDMIFVSAQRARSEYLSMQNIVAGLGQRASDAFSSNEEILQFAENLQKQFVIAGASQEEMAAASLQLTQALGSGVLRGDELNSVFEQAPNVIQTIADYMGVPIGKIREMASEGEITANIVKNAMLGATDEINAQFESMPKTFGQIMTSIQNYGVKAFEPLLQKLTEIGNSEGFSALVHGVTNALIIVANVVATIFSLITSVAGFAYDHWNVIEPVIIAAAVALGLYVSALTAYKITQGVINTIKGISIALEKAHMAAMWLSSDATFAETAAQWGLNSALLACPITWVVLGFMALVAILYIVIAVINEVCGTSLSATGIIAGAVFALGAIIYNIGVMIYNFLVFVIVGIYNIGLAVITNLGTLWNWLWVSIANIAILVINTIIAAFVTLYSIFAVIVAGLGAIFDYVWKFVANIAISVAEWIVNNWNSATLKVQQFFANIGKTGATAFKSVTNAAGSAASAIANAFVSGANAAIKAINWIIDAINLIPGVDIDNVKKIGKVDLKFDTSGIDSYISEMDSILNKTADTVSFDRFEYDGFQMPDLPDVGDYTLDFLTPEEWTTPDGLADPSDYYADFKDIGEAYNNGYEWGSNLVDGIKNFDPTQDLLDSLPNTDNLTDSITKGIDNSSSKPNTGKIADNTEKIADSMDITDDELKYLRDLAEQEAINRFTTAEIKLEITNNNNISKDTDLDGVIDYMTSQLEEKMNIAAEGV